MPLQPDALSRITISGYKSIRSCDLSLGRVNVLIGSNGSGKSNLLSAFSFLQDVLSHNLQLTVALRSPNALLYNGKKTTDEIAFEVFFGAHSYGFNLVPTDDNQLVFREEYFQSQDQPETKHIVSRGTCESLWDSDTQSQMSHPVVPILEKQTWRVYHFHDTGRSARVKQEHNISNCMVLMPDAANLAAFLYRLKLHYRKHYERIVRIIQLIAPFFADFVLEPQEWNPEQIILKWRQKGGEDVLYASQLSDGTLRFACLATLLLQPPKLQPPTILIDEPELGLHPFSLTILAELIHQVSLQKQIILSTQSVDLLDAFDVADVIAADRGENGSEFRRLNEEEVAFWLEEGYSLGELWMKNLLGGNPSIW